jgi:hypothetical protein
MERPTMNEAQSGGLRDPSSLHFREQNPEDAAQERTDATVTFEAGRIRLSLDDELKCDPYNRRGRLMRGSR